MADVIETLWRWAVRHPGVEEGDACAGTALARRTVRVRNKAFVFLGGRELRLKLGDSLAEAERLAQHEPRRYQVGAHGWVKVDLTEAVAIERLKRWIDESHGLARGSAIARARGAKQGARGQAGAPKKAAKKTATKKRARA
jgi:hypothetical protein